MTCPIPLQRLQIMSHDLLAKPLNQQMGHSLLALAP
uniref:Uncharacterized protein n=1 Tax=Arundo donax TaxID=35708 RepID=A0A0A9ATY3_ARUDO